MNLAPFLLDEWLDRYKHAGIRHDLASSTGPAWTLAGLLELSTEEERRALFEEPLFYSVGAGAPALRAGIASLHGVSPDDVLVMTGASEVLHVLFFSLAEPGANVVVSHPGFPPTQNLPAALGLEVRTYHLRPETEFGVDLDEVRRLVDGRTRLLLATSPQNPTGAVLDEATKKELARIAADNGALLVVDEVYHPLYPSAPAETAARLDGVLVAGDFSKALCLSGLRLGYLIDKDHARRERWLNARVHFTVSNTSFGEGLGTLALRHRETIFARARARVAANVASWARSVDRLAGLVGFVPPRGGTTAFPWLTFTENSRPFAESLAAEGVLVVPGDCFGMPRHFRIGFGADQDFASALETVERVVRHTATSTQVSAQAAAAAR